MKQPALANLTTYDPNPLLTAVSEHLNVKKDVELARALAIAPPIISKIRHRKMVVGPSLLIRMLRNAGMLRRDTPYCLASSLMVVPAWL
jgi:hypothetical protein